MKKITPLVLWAVFALAACGAGEPPVYREGDAPTRIPKGALLVPDSIPPAIVDAINARPVAFFSEFRAAVDADTDALLPLVDKTHPLPEGFAPADLTPLAKGKSYLANRAGLSLRAPAEAALEGMARAALADGVTIAVSSSYRSYDYQKTVYERNVRELGQAAADRESAKPGTSQHQLGTAMDLGSITDGFALTKAGMWMVAHGGEWGWSLSFPEGYESVTGYRWESWHWRYVGIPAAELQRKWFGNVQQYMMEFIDAWRRYSAS